MNIKRQVPRATAAVLLALALVACSDDQNGADDGDGNTFEGFQPDNTTLMVSAGPGSGSDTLARQITDLLTAEEIAEGNWPVENMEEGAGAAAMAHLAENEGDDELVAIAPMGWVTTPLDLGDNAVTVHDLTPICQLVVEPMVVAVSNDSPFESLSDIIEAAQQGEELVQVGGQVGSINDLAREQLAAETGAEWTYLPVESGGERIPALLRGDADMMFGSPADFVGQTVDDGGELRIVSTIAPERTDLFPDAPTHEEEGYDFDIGLAFRGVMGPPGMSDEAIQYYQDTFEELLGTAAWQDVAAEFGYATEFRPSDEWATYLKERESELIDLLGKG